MTNGEATDDSFPLKVSTVLREQNIELNKRRSKLSKDLEDKYSGYNKQVLEDVELIFYKNKIYVPQCLRRCTLDWYHFYLNHLGGDRLAKTLTEVCYWKGLANQAKQHAKRCKICQTFTKRSKHYVKIATQRCWAAYTLAYCSRGGPDGSVHKDSEKNTNRWHSDWSRTVSHLHDLHRSCNRMVQDRTGTILWFGSNQSTKPRIYW